MKLKCEPNCIKLAFSNTSMPATDLQPNESCHGRQACQLYMYKYIHHYTYIEYTILIVLKIELPIRVVNQE